MKNITLTNYTPPRRSTRTATRYYTTFLYDTEYRFTSQKAVETFLNSHAAKLNAHLRDLNAVYGMVFFYARAAWQRDTFINYAEYIPPLDFNFEQVYKIQRSNSANAFVYKNYFAIVDLLSRLINQLIDINKKGGFYEQVRLLKIYRSTMQSHANILES